MELELTAELDAQLDHNTAQDESIGAQNASSRQTLGKRSRVSDEEQEDLNSPEGISSDDLDSDDER